MKSGWLAILQNEKQLLVHSRNVNNVAQIRAAHNALANRKEAKRKHMECGPKRMREDEQCVQDLSAMPASDELIADFNSAHAAGKEKLTSFLQDRVFSKNTSLHACFPLSKRLTFAKAPCTEKPGEELKARAAEMERNALKAVINTYMKLGDPFPSAREFKTLLCSVSNKGWLQKLICSYLTDLAQNVDAEMVYSVGSHCTNLSTQQPMQNYSFDQSEADTILFSAYAVLRESGYSGPVIIDTADTDAYVVAAAISQQLTGMLCIKRKQETVLCRSLVTEEMADCIVQLHCITGCDANSGFYGKGKSSVYDKVAKSPVAQQQHLQCGDSLDPEEEVVEELFEFTRHVLLLRHVIYGDKKSSTMAEAHAAKWKRTKNKSFIRLPPDADSLRQHCLRANFLAYLVPHPSLKHHPSPLGHGWELVGGRCRPVRHTRPALPTHLPAPGPAEESEEDDEREEDEEEGDDDVQRRRGDSSESDDSESSEAECSDSD
ncbi:hypothetical protein SKAU_G00247620 [Synaphobranchus kaupii]|uniref:Uncharacterized protein n=1 Tax=Synaphobranchus kaupii TaxID=118154 RepID=A0A9Q1F269_SYNKA|nr:hypothetical protein SKAU_G00247620 [Synaphobranchus kaupii]